MNEVSASGSVEKGEKKEEEELLKECQKLIDLKVDTEDFICEIEKRPPIWNSSIEDYSTKHVKLNAWKEVMCTFISDFEERSSVEKNNLLALIQKKWKSIRTCYTGEVLRLKGVKSGSAAKRKKQYMYFDQLRFLDTSVKKTTTSVDEVDIVDDQEENEASISLLSTPIINTRTNSRKRSNNEDELIEVLKKKIALTESSTSDNSDEDRMFLLSMLSEVHKVPAERKLKLRADMISLVAAAQTPLHHGWQEAGYTGHPYHPMPGQSMHQHRMLQQPVQHHHMQQYPMQQPPPVPQYPMQQHPVLQHPVVQQPIQQHPMQQPHMQQNPTSELVIQEPQINLLRSRLQQSQDTNTALQSPLSVETSVMSNDGSEETQLSDVLQLE